MLPSQWVTLLHCNNISNCLGAYLDQSLISLNKSLVSNWTGEKPLFPPIITHAFPWYIKLMHLTKKIKPILIMLLLVLAWWQKLHNDISILLDVFEWLIEAFWSCQYMESPVTFVTKQQTSQHALRLLTQLIQALVKEKIYWHQSVDIIHKIAERFALSSLS